MKSCFKRLLYVCLIFSVVASQAAIPENNTQGVVNAKKETVSAPLELLGELEEFDRAESEIENELSALVEKPKGVDHAFSPELIEQELAELIDESELVAATNRRKARPGTSKAKTKAKESAKPIIRARSKVTGDRSLLRAETLVKEKRYHEASRLLFQLSRNPRYQKDWGRIRYVLGLVLYEMKLYQTAAFVFYDVVKAESESGGRSRYLRQGLEKLALAADALDSDVLLRYAIKKVNEDDFPAAHRDMLYYRVGELKLAEKQYTEAARQFARVKPQSQFFSQSKYKQALAYAESGELERAQNVFSQLAASSPGITSVNRVNAILGQARVLYQRQEWDAAIEAYRQIPRDTDQWHDALFESTWAMLRSAKFRSALSNFHSLHSDYYEDVYQPESLLLRAIVYLFICRYDEMEKVLTLFERAYRPVLTDVQGAMKTMVDPISYYREINRVAQNFSSLRNQTQARNGYKLPFLVSRKILREGDVRRTLSYLARLEEEKARAQAMPTSWTASGVGRYSRQVLDRRMDATQKFIGQLVRRHVNNISRELTDLFEQNGFLRLEVIRGKKDVVKKEIAGKGLSRGNVDAASDRQFFVQNGYEYWPFKGEYWLDEIGNYHFVGVQACE